MLMSAASGCKHAPAPYPRGQAPSVETLVQATHPVLDAVAVPEARIVADRFARAELAFLAQTPSRFRATITKSGNELASLAFHEEGYTLRYKLDQFPSGFYAGPSSSACAVEALIGVPLAYESLVALVLGGGPILDAPYTVLSQRWNGEDDAEELVIANDRFVEELEFAWIAGAWRFEGAQLWVRDSAGNKGRRLWRLDHGDFQRVGDSLLPDETVIRAPGERRDHRIVIHYERRDLDPAWARSTPVDPQHPGEEVPPEQTDPWADDGEWEDEPATGAWDDAPSSDGGDDGWESTDASPTETVPPQQQLGTLAPAQQASTAAPTQQPPTAAPTQQPSTAAPAQQPSTATPAPSAQPTEHAAAGGASPAPDKQPPPLFTLEPAGLAVRGDLCR